MSIHWAIQIATAPTSEAISLADAKNYLRVTNASDDTLIAAMIQAAREYCENRTARALTQTQYLLTLDRFPFPSNYDRALYSQDQFLPIGPTNQPFYDQFAIFFPRNPVLTVDTVKYLDVNGTLTTLASSEYVVDKISLQGRLLPAFGKSWPIAQYIANAVQVTFTAGSTSAATVTAGTRVAMFMHVSKQYENRVPGQVDDEKVLNAIDRVLDPYVIECRDAGGGGS